MPRETKKRAKLPPEPIDKDPRVIAFKRTAREMAADRHKRKEQYRIIKRLVYEEYGRDAPHNGGPTKTSTTASGFGGLQQSTSITATEQLATAPSSNSSSSVSPCSMNLPRRVIVDWEQLAYFRGRPGAAGITLRTMLSIAVDAYRVAGAPRDLSAMTLAEHVQHVEAARAGARAPGADGEGAPAPRRMCDVIVTRPLLLAALAQRHRARHDFLAWLATYVAFPNLPRAVRETFRRCRNCSDWFWPRGAGEGPCVAGGLCSWHRPCRFHPGYVLCNGDQVNSITEAFARWEVKLSDFNMWAQNLDCYWSCCGARLVEETGEEDVERADDGSPGCVIQQHEES
ncbi:hypothetical protein GGS23DRAFT_543037 [Durotheca rogersii]|uniref:uncharacterized protein n=1 Tax=Durotheca rogersii TaxID=419775 RepID=UPI00221EA757|nr:uncharacterized protein GGS23DRAFT_543037 [Durotheca rogersii]KAI5867897.1 hypothetical protein GGS23DRAFT_543037 [Durotheca rogersii]